jgi:hypothetical protein
MSEKVAWITLTSGRKNYLKQSRESWYRLVSGKISEEIIVDTSGNLEYREWLLKEYPSAKVFSLTPEDAIRKDWNSGISQAYEYFYNIAKTIDCDYVLHTEDDYTLLNPLDINDAIDILKSDSHIVQVHFIRQPWTKDESENGGVLKNCQRMGSLMTQKDNGKSSWVEHRSYFTFGPSIYKKEICFTNRDLNNNPELALTHSLFLDPKNKTATFGTIDDMHFVEHIGVEKG